MLTLCLACHAKVTRTFYVQGNWPEFLRTLWRAQHPEGHEQTELDFTVQPAPAKAIPLFEGVLTVELKRGVARTRS
jgi:hypothetical protein